MPAKAGTSASAERPARRVAPQGRRRTATGRAEAQVRTAPAGGRVFDRVYAIVRGIPRGRVMTYGQISRTMRGRLSAAAVGWAMRGCPDDVPWHRVVNAAGGCSTDGLGPHPPGWQRALLEAERVVFDADGTMDLDRFRWAPRAPSALPADAPRRSAAPRRRA